MSQPRVHVAIPVRGVGQWLEEALDSLVAQSFTDWSATLVVDAAVEEDDACFAIGRRWAQQDDRIECLLPGRVGLPGALNIAVAEAQRSQLLARFDGDDLCDPLRFEKQVSYLDAHPEIDVLDSRAMSFRDPKDGQLPEGMKRYQAWHSSIETHADFQREFLVENPVCHPCVMMRTNVLQRLDEPDEPYRDNDCPEDYDLWRRLLGAGARFHKLPEVLVRWRDHPGRSTRTQAIYKKKAFFHSKWRHFAAHILPKAGPIAVCGAAREGKRWIRALAEAGHLPVAVADVSPKAIGSTRHGAPVVPLSQLIQYKPSLALVAVGTAGARTLIESELHHMNIRSLAVAGLAG